MKPNFTDIRFDVVEKIPEKYRPYALLARLDRPTGIWLLLIPCLWGMVAALGGLINISFTSVWYFILFCFGAVIMRAAGCIINDLWDQKLDSMVERTQQRPLANGQVSRRHAYIFLFILMIFGYLILIQLPTFSVIIGMFSMLLVVAYPLMKRMTWWPQAFLGITFNIGVLIGWAAITGIVEMPALLIYVSGIFWTLSYDTIYAYQDIEDDAKIGIKSTARLFGKKGKKIVAAFYVTQAIFLIGAGILTHAFVTFYPILAVAIWKAYKIHQEWDSESQESSLLAFKQNVILGLIILAAFIFS